MLASRQRPSGKRTPGNTDATVILSSVPLHHRKCSNRRISAVVVLTLPSMPASWSMAGPILSNLFSAFQRLLNDVTGKLVDRKV